MEKEPADAERTDPKWVLSTSDLFLVVMATWFTAVAVLFLVEAAEAIRSLSPAPFDERPWKGLSQIGLVAGLTLAVGLPVCWACKPRVKRWFKRREVPDDEELLDRLEAGISSSQ